MPTPKKTSPPPPVASGVTIVPMVNGTVNHGRPDDDDIMYEGMSVTRIKELYQKVIIYGPNRTGKSTLACEWPKPAIVISFEPGRTGGATSLTKYEGVYFMPVTSTEKAFKLAARLKGDRRSNWKRDARGKWVELLDDKGRPSFTGDPFVTDIIDSCTSLQDVILKELMGWEETRNQLSFASVSKEIYQARSERTRDVLRPFLDLPAHTIVIAHEKDHNPPKDDRNKLTRGLQIESFIAPDLGGATVTWLQDNCGYICRLYIADEVVMQRVPTGVKDDKGKDIFNEIEVATGKKIRRLLTLPQSCYAAGFRSSSPEVVPDWIDGKSPTDLYQKIQKVIRGESL